MSKFLIGIILTLCIAIAILAWRYSIISSKLEYETYKNLNLESKLDTQNKEIDKIKLDTEKYSESKEKQIQEIENKYNKILNRHVLRSEESNKNSVLKNYLTTQNASLDSKQCEELEIKHKIAQELLKKFYEKDEQKPLAKNHAF